MNKGIRALALLLNLFAYTLPAAAHHVVWLDFSAFDLSPWAGNGGVNLNDPPTITDVTAVEQLVVAGVSRDYAPFEIHFTTLQPAQGRYTQIRILPTVSADGSTLGTVGCLLSGCTGIGSWWYGLSVGEVYSGTYSLFNTFLGPNATTQRIANGIAWTISHELGHILGLLHCNAVDTWSVPGPCNGNADPNRTAHTMSTNNFANVLATTDAFFSVHSSRQELYRELQSRNHWNLLRSVDADSTGDLTYMRASQFSPVTTFNRLSDGSSFGSWSVWAASTLPSYALVGDVNNDGMADLVHGLITSSTTVWWVVALAQPGGFFGPFSTWASDAGDAGDIFRLGDVDGDGDDDLVYGRPHTATEVQWFVRLAGPTGFGSSSSWSANAGQRGDDFLIGDVTGDQVADLVAVNRDLAGTRVKTFASTTTSFVHERDDVLTFLSPDYLFLGDATGDGMADLITGDRVNDYRIDWTVRPSNGCIPALSGCFSAVTTFVQDGGDVGDLFRIGDGNGDGMVDLFYGRSIGINTLAPASTNLGWLRWYGRLSTGSSFGGYTTWASDAGDDGDLFP